MEEGFSTTKISYKVGKQTKKVKRSGTGNYCCVPNCKSIQYKVDNKAKIKTGIAFFSSCKNSKKKKGLASKVYPDFGKEEGKINSM